MQAFSIDYRSLALFRMALGLVVLYSLATFVPVADMVLARDGIFPSRELQQYFRGSWSWSVNWLIDATWFQYVVLAATAAATVCMIVGRHTRLATVLAWVLLTSLYKCVSPVLGGGDVLLNVLLFWAMFLPLETRWSLDARRQTPPTNTSLASAATVAILLQMAFMYFFTGISKFNDVWFSGSALGIGFSIDRVTRPLGHWLADFPRITAQISRGTLAAELILPFVLFSPWKSRWCRSIALLMLIAFHVGIEATMVVVMFSYASLAGLTLFIPSFWWSYPPLRQLQSVLDRIFAVPSQPPPAKHSRDKRHSQRQRDVGQGLDLRRLLRGAAITALVVYVLLYNVIVSFASADLKRSLGFFQRWGELFSLQQYWDMFNDPSPNCNEIACVARLRDGTQIDLLRDNIEVDDRAAFPSRPATYDELRKMIWASVVTYPNNRVFLKSYVEYECRQYNETVNDPSQRIEDCRLMYYPYGPNPYAKKFSFAELQSVKLRP